MLPSSSLRRASVLLRTQCAPSTLSTRCPTRRPSAHSRPTSRRAYLLIVPRLRSAGPGLKIHIGGKGVRKDQSELCSWLLMRFDCTSRPRAVAQRRDHAATRIQARIRGHLARKRQRTVRAATVIQRAFRRYHLHSEAARREASATRVQATWRAYKARRAFVALCAAAQRMQAVVRARRQHARTSAFRAAGLSHVAKCIPPLLYSCSARKERKRKACMHARLCFSARFIASVHLRLLLPPFSLSLSRATRFLLKSYRVVGGCRVHSHRPAEARAPTTRPRRYSGLHTFHLLRARPLPCSCNRRQAFGEHSSHGMALAALLCRSAFPSSPEIRFLVLLPLERTQRLRTSVVKAQACWRGHVARRQVTIMRAAGPLNDSGTLLSSCSRAMILRRAPGEKLGLLVLDHYDHCIRPGPAQRFASSALSGATACASARRASSRPSSAATVYALPTAAREWA